MSHFVANFSLGSLVGCNDWKRNCDCTSKIPNNCLVYHRLMLVFLVGGGGGGCSLRSIARILKTEVQQLKILLTVLFYVWTKLILLSWLKAKIILLLEVIGQLSVRNLFTNEQQAQTFYETTVTKLTELACTLSSIRNNKRSFLKIKQQYQQHSKYS